MRAINDLNRHIEPIKSALEEAVARVINSGWFVLGPEVEAFENEFAAYCGVSYCVGLANGSDALELALRALEIGKGCKVLTVANAGMYSTAAILATGAMPMYAEVSANTWQMDTDDAIRLIGEHTVDAIIVTHLYGLMADIDPLLRIAKGKQIPVIEDCAQAHGAMRANKKAGSFADAACFSFYPTKNLGALGDGGAVVTQRDDVRQRIIKLRQYGWESKYLATLPGGRNSRLDELQAAALRVMLPMLDGWNSRRRAIAARYSLGICHKNIVVPPIYGPEYVAHLYVIRVSGRSDLQRYLFEHEIPSEIHYPIPDYRQPSYRYLFADEDKPVTEQQCAEVLTLPCFPSMLDTEVDMIISKINAWTS